MSYREIRVFTEYMRTLGYPRLISMENFRKPNFELVADLLYWMVKLYDPETTISDRVEFENERVEFLTSIASLMAVKARLKLNTKKLYASDGRAVQEMLKIATLLYKASRSVSSGKATLDEDNTPPPIKVQEVKTTRGLASDITRGGAKLYDLLATEAVDRQERQKALRFLDVASSSAEGSREYAFIERSIKDIIERTRQAVDDLKKEGDDLDSDERNIELKIRKKQEELERTEKRMKSLESVRPQFMDEVEKLEKELQRHYDIYIEKFRNLDYLEHELGKYHKLEEEKREEQERRLKKMRERLLKDEVELLRGEGRQPGSGDIGYGAAAKGGSRGSGFKRTGSDDDDENVSAVAKKGGSSGAARARAKASVGAKQTQDDDSDEFLDDDDVSDDSEDLDSGSDDNF